LNKRLRLREKKARLQTVVLIQTEVNEKQESLIKLYDELTYVLKGINEASDIILRETQFLEPKSRNERGEKLVALYGLQERRLVKEQIESLIAKETKEIATLENKLRAL